MINSPFKFLDSYTKDDASIFFGREQETEDLYRKIFENKTLLVYGVSGTGKTSIINCGLANKFNDADWLPITIRRNQNMVESFYSALHKLSPDTKDKGKRDAKAFIKLLQSVYLDHFKPVYLLFDQFEELFIFGDEEEQQAFVDIIAQIKASDVQVKILFIMREEYLANMSAFEEKIPDLLTNRLRIEKMSTAKVKEAITGPCNFAEIGIENEAVESIIEKLTRQGKTIELTYLQVLLDRLFHKAVQEQKGDKLQFTQSLVASLGEVSDILGDFLEEQIRQFDNPDQVLDVLKSFVSVRGTKRQSTVEEIGNHLRSLNKAQETDTLQTTIQQLVNLRILREKDENDRYELRHDALAMKIYEKVTLVEKELIEVRDFLENALNNFQKRGRLLSVEDLKYIAPYEDKFFLNKQLQKFIERSKHEIHKAKRRKRNLVLISGIILLIIFSAFTFWALTEKNKSDKMFSNNIQLLYAFVPDTTKQFYRYFENIAAKYLDEADYSQAFRYYRFARLSPDVPPDLEQVIVEKETKSETLMNLNKQAVEYFRNLQHKKAENIYNQMLQFMPGDTILNQRIWHCQNPAFTKENLIFIKGGTFTMGSDADYADDDEIPHTVTLTDFYMSKYEVTNAEFAEFLNIYGSDKILEGDYKNQSMISYGNLGIIKKSKIWVSDKDSLIDYAPYPVIRVTWFGANEFCLFWKGTLPSEAQWEYSASNGGKNYKYSWGNEELGKKKVANIADKTFLKKYPDYSGEAGYDDGYAITSPVGVFPPNELGIYDMTGNVYEWCNDWYGRDYYSNSPQNNPQGPSSGSHRVLRGGSWDYYAERCRVAYRSDDNPGFSYNNNGFRLVVVP